MEQIVTRRGASGPVGRVWFLPRVEGRTWPEVTASCLLGRAPRASVWVKGTLERFPPWPLTCSCDVRCQVPPREGWGVEGESSAGTDGWQLLRPGDPTPPAPPQAVVLAARGQAVVDIIKSRFSVESALCNQQSDFCEPESSGTQTRARRRQKGLPSAQSLCF